MNVQILVVYYLIIVHLRPQKISSIIIEVKTREKFCKCLKEHAMKIINFEIKETIPLTHEENESYLKEKVYHICKKEFIFDVNLFSL